MRRMGDPVRAFVVGPWCPSLFLLGLKVGRRDFDPHPIAPLHCRLRQPRLVSGLRIALDLFQRRLSADARDLMHRASGLREPPTCGLPQTMKRARGRQACVVACLGKPCGEGVRIERLAAIALVAHRDQSMRMAALAVAPAQRGRAGKQQNVVHDFCHGRSPCTAPPHADSGNALPSLRGSKPTLEGRKTKEKKRMAGHGLKTR